MWWLTVKSGGDSGAPRQVSDIDGGFGRPSSTAVSRGGHGELSRAENCACVPPSERGAGRALRWVRVRATTHDLHWRCPNGARSRGPSAIRDESNLVGWVE